MIPLNKSNTRDPEKLPSGNPICDAGLAIHKDGKHPMVRGTCARSFVVLFGTLNSTPVPVTTKTGTMARKTEDAPNTSRSLMTTGSPLTEVVLVLSAPMSCIPNANVTTLVLRHPSRNSFGSVTLTAPPTWTRWLISPPWPLPVPLSCPLPLTPTAPPNSFAARPDFAHFSLSGTVFAAPVFLRLFFARFLLLSSLAASILLVFAVLLISMV